jgi:DNA-binding transcriptional MerR regulator
MAKAFTIGDFSRATHLTVKTLRHYHETGLLEPAAVDPATGYRRYTVEQISIAQIIRRFRELDMPLPEIRSVIEAKDLAKRNELIAAHLRRLEGELARTRDTVASLRNLLEPSTPNIAVGRRRVEKMTAAAIRETIRAKDAVGWFTGALGELSATLAAQGRSATSPPGGIFSNALFNEGQGEGVIFFPCSGPVRAVGRVAPYTVPAVELATLVHEGSHCNLDLTYGALAAYVGEHALAVEGPLREIYLVGAHVTTDQRAWRTEIGWPIFATG